MTPIADAELVQRSRQRDTSAFGELVERHQRLVFGVALARCGDPALAEDVVQEAFVTAWRDLDRLRDTDRVGTWVAGIARNLAGSAVRTRARRATPPVVEIPPVPTPEDAALEREDRELLARALADVPDTHRETLVLYYLEGESIARIAELLGISDDLVKQRLSRGRRALREGVANRVETALSRARERPGLRAGVIAALVTAGTRRASAGKVVAVMTIKKVAIALGVLAVAGSAVWIGTHRAGDSARASSKSSPPAAAQKSAPYVKRIDAETRQKLVAAIHEAQRREPTRSTSSASSSPAHAAGPRPELPAEPPDLDKDYIRSCVRELIPLITECYEQALERDPKIKGSVVVDFTIDGARDVGGVVSESSIDDKESTLTDPSVRECIQQTMYSLEISAPQDGGQVRVHYPFTFSPAGDDDSK